MEKVFNLTNKKPPLKIPDFKFIGYHQLQPNIAYYIRKYDDYKNFDLLEAKIEDRHKLFKRYTLGAGTNIKYLDSFMYAHLKYRKDEKVKDYKTFLDLVIKDSNLEKTKSKYENSKIPKQFEKEPLYLNLKAQGYKLLYVVNSDERQKIEQSYMVFVKETNEKLLDTDINYIIFKPIQLITKMSYLQGKSGSKYNIHEYQELNIPTSILK